MLATAEEALTIENPTEIIWDVTTVPELQEKLEETLPHTDKLSWVSPFSTTKSFGLYVEEIPSYHGTSTQELANLCKELTYVKSTRLGYSEAYSTPETLAALGVVSGNRYDDRVWKYNPKLAAKQLKKQKAKKETEYVTQKELGSIAYRLSKYTFHGACYGNHDAIEQLWLMIYLIDKLHGKNAHRRITEWREFVQLWKSKKQGNEKYYNIPGENNQSRFYKWMQKETRARVPVENLLHSMKPIGSVHPYLRS